MANSRKISREQQYAALYLGSQLEDDRRKYFLGSAKVDIDTLCFNSFLPREINDQNVQRLLSSFELTGCLQLDPQHHLPAIITPTTFHEAVSQADSTNEAASDRDASRWPTVSFPPQLQIQCLRGKHCIDVAKQYLTGRARWWVIDFYSEGETVQREDVALFSGNLELICRPQQRFADIPGQPDIQRAAAQRWRSIFSHPSL